MQHISTLNILNFHDILKSFVDILYQISHMMSMFPIFHFDFYTPWNREKKSGFMMFSGVVEM